MISTINKNKPSTSTPESQSEFIHADIIVFAMPPKICAEIHFQPPLPLNKTKAMKNTPIWMSNTAKIIFIYKTPFWKDNGYSGTAFSNCGPLAQIWDSCGYNPDSDSDTSTNTNTNHTNQPVYALASFIFDDLDGIRDLIGVDYLNRCNRYNAGSDIDSNIEYIPKSEVSNSPIISQLVTIFGEQAKHPIGIHYKTWRLDPIHCDSSDNNNGSQLPFGSPLVSKRHEGYIFAGMSVYICIYVILYIYVILCMYVCMYIILCVCIHAILYGVCI